MLFSRNFAYAKFRENNILAKIFEFTVIRAETVAFGNNVCRYVIENLEYFDHCN